MAHALGGFVEQHQLRFHRQGGGNFQRALAAVGHVNGDGIGKLGQVDLGQQGHRALIELVELALALPEMKGGAELALQADAHVLQHRQVREHGRNLERTDDAHAGNLGWPGLRNVAAIEQDMS